MTGWDYIILVLVAVATATVVDVFIICLLILAKRGDDTRVPPERDRRNGPNDSA